ncbi:MAG: hypothetical protein CES88_13140 [Halobacteriovorax sp. JY17]|nr:MAG: hypothetical protein CES88_13140 [Halobacteriovorax sp. JY17]
MAVLTTFFFLFGRFFLTTGLTSGRTFSSSPPSSINILAPKIRTRPTNPSRITFCFLAFAASSSSSDSSSSSSSSSNSSSSSSDSESDNLSLTSISSVFSSNSPSSSSYSSSSSSDFDPGSFDLTELAKSLILSFRSSNILLSFEGFNNL